MEKRILGKKNRESGARFERKVRLDLEKKSWIVDRWTNNIEIVEEFEIKEISPKVQEQTRREVRKLVPAKSNRFGMRTTGFPDFIAFQFVHIHIYTKIGGIKDEQKNFHIIGVECKSNGYLDKEERAKCKWMLENNIFSTILIARKSEKRGKIEYLNFLEKYGKL